MSAPPFQRDIGRTIQPRFFCTAQVFFLFPSQLLAKIVRFYFSSLLAFFCFRPSYTFSRLYDFFRLWLSGGWDWEGRIGRDGCMGDLFFVGKRVSFFSHR